MGVVSFDYAAWSAQFPALAQAVPQELAQLYFDRRCPLYLDNTDCSIVEDTNPRAALLDLLVAHIATVSGAGGAAGSGLVGRVQSATQGSETVSMAAYPSEGALEAWYAQTPYGAQFWAATARYRSAFYVPGVQPNFEAWPPIRGGVGWPGA